MKNYKRIVIKIGTDVITDEVGLLDKEVLKHLVYQIVELGKVGVEVVMVSSGAVGAGKAILDIDESSPVKRRQVLASIGQVELMDIYKAFFRESDRIAAQIIATREDFRDREHYLNMKNCFEALLHHKVVPIVNENDVTSISEKMFSDNDEFAGLIGTMLNVDAIFLLTNVDGLYDRHPDEEGAKLLSIVDKNMPIEKYISKKKSGVGRGGMLAKCDIARKIAKLGVPTHIIHGAKKNIILDIVNGENLGTTFVPNNVKNISSIKKWLAHCDGHEQGVIIINKGAEEVISSKKGASILPVGVAGFEGDFQKGDIIKICSESGYELGYGKAQYDSVKLLSRIGKRKQKEIIHYDYLFLVE